MEVKSVKEKKSIELNSQFKNALHILENTNRNIFITGRAGTGKSTLLEYFRKNSKKRAVILAPTGVAALNVKGQTIHSFFRFKPNITLSKVKKLKEDNRRKKNIYKETDLLIIDEISMVRCDLLDCVDKFLRLNGKDKNQLFGGTQVAFIGDLYQLPPVVTSSEKEIFMTQYESPYFFDAKVFEAFDMEFIELEKIYRQKDDHFIKLLNSIRNKTLTDTDLDNLNDRLQPDFRLKNGDFYICLTTTNQMADEINHEEVSRLKTDPFSFHGIIEGDFEMRSLPTQLDLDMKVGAQVMFLNNDSKERWVNGSIGKVVDILAEQDNDLFDEPVLIVEMQDGKKVEVKPYTWDIFNYKFDQQIHSITTEVVGSFTQFPLRLAWAVTIHKSQGKTFDKVIIDIGRGTFSHGQVYVALSRCTSLEGIILKKPIAKRHIWMDYKVLNFLTEYQYKISEQNCSYEDKVIIIEAAIANEADLEIVYLKADDTKNKRQITPCYIDEMQYKGKNFEGLRAFCKVRQEERTFRIDRMLEINTLVQSSVKK